MKWLFALWFLLASPLWAGDAVLYVDYGRLLQQYVRDSRVDYHAWSKNDADRQALADHLIRMSEVDLATLTDAEQQAFYINLYNAAMLQTVLDHYPVKSVTDIRPAFGVFREKFIQLGDETVSLDQIEKDILLKQWSEPRHHMAVNCASASCPPLRNEPFTGAQLDRQLTEQAKQFANSFYAAQLDRPKRAVWVSALFDWYADDFPGETPLHWLNQYRTKSLPTDHKVVFLEYDWSLNEALDDSDS